MKIAIVGCGYVADFYLNNLKSHPDLQLRGAYDRDRARLEVCSRHYGFKPYTSLQALLDDGEVELVLNLTNPRSHFEVSAAAIRAGKHVYSEKPLGMDSTESQQLVELASAHGVRLACAPCSVLSDTAQTLWKALREGAIGRVRMVYANFDDGMIAPKLKPWSWASESGALWPAKDEFEIGCTYEHAGYFLTWLGAFFGPARRVTAFSSCQIPNKGIPVDGMAPDFSVGCIEYDQGVVARVTTGLVAPVDKSLTVIGDDGCLVVRYIRNDKDPVLIHRSPPAKAPTLERAIYLAREKARAAATRLRIPLSDSALYGRYPMLDFGPFAPAAARKYADFMRGPQDMLDAIRDGRPHALSADFSMHIVELIETLQHPERFGHRREITSSFATMQPLAPPRHSYVAP